MNTTLFYARYLITAIIAYLSMDEVGPLSALIVFVIANAIWTRAEEALIDAGNVRQTRRWEKRNKV